MSRLLLLCCALACVTALTACGGSSSDAPKTKSLTASDSDSTVSLAKKQSLTIALASNPSTGYHWDVTTKPDPAVVVMGPAAYSSGAASTTSTAPIVGAPGEQRYTLTGVAQGTTVFETDYVPPGRGQAPAKRFRIVIKVG